MRIGRIATALGLFIAACSGDGDGGGGGGGGEGPFLPMEPGATWTYRVTDTTTATVSTKVTTVGDLEDVGGAKAGVTAYRVTTQKGGGDVTISWQEDTGTGIVRHRERALDATGALKNDDIYQPYKLRLDESAEHTAAGASWSETYTETVTDAAGITATVTKNEAWTVEASDESVTVPAGTFTCLRVRKTSQTTSSKEARRARSSMSWPW